MIQQTENSIIISPNPVKAGIAAVLYAAFFILLIAVGASSNEIIGGPEGSFNFIRGGVVLVVLSLIIFILTYLTAKKTKYVFTENNIQYNEGFLTIENKMIQYDRITDISHKKSFPLDHLLDTGTVIINTAGGVESKLGISYVDDIESVYETLKQAVGAVLSKNNSMASKVQGSISSNSAGQPFSAIEIKPLAKPLLVKRFIGLLLWVSIILVLSFLTILAFSPERSMPDTTPEAIERYKKIAWIIAGALELTGSLILLLTMFLAYKNQKAKKYVFYQDRVEYNEGFLTIRQKTIQYSRITDISYFKGWFWGKMFDVSSIQINTAGHSGPELIMSDIPNAEEHYQNLRSLIQGIGSSNAGVV